MNTPISSMASVIFGSVIGSFAAAGLKAGAQRLEFNVRALVSNWQLIAGGAGYLLSTVFFIQGLRHGELSVLYPMVSVGYICNMLWSKLLFGEQITGAKIGALALILAGVTLLGLGATR
jgi:multidrug transporter EmrE-like cation transporter